MKQMETYSGVPAFSPAQREYYETKRAEVLERFKAFEGDPDLYRLPIPFLTLSFTEWRKRDLKVARINPVHLALLCGRASKRQEDELEYELQCARDSDLVDEETYEKMHAEIVQRRESRIRELRGMVSE